MHHNLSSDLPHPKKSGIMIATAPKKPRIIMQEDEMVLKKLGRIAYRSLKKLTLRSRTSRQKSAAPQAESDTEATSGGFVGGVRSGPSPNDQRSDALNPNNSAHSAAADNRSNQMNPNNSAYGSSRR